MKQWVEQFNGRMDAWGRKLQGKEIRIPIDLVTGIVFALFALVPIWLYQGRQGLHGKVFRWFCYAFYPVHMLILFIIRGQMLG